MYEQHWLFVDKFHCEKLVIERNLHHMCVQPIVAQSTITTSSKQTKDGWPLTFACYEKKEKKNVAIMTCHSLSEAINRNRNKTKSI